MMYRLTEREAETPAANKACACAADSGFTLVEMLVALSLLAFVSLMTSTFISQLKIWNVRLSSDGYRQELALAAGHIERIVEDALLLPIDLNDNDTRQYFLGTPTQMTFVSHARAGLLESALRTVQFGIDQTADGRQLYQSLGLRRFNSSFGDEDQRIAIVENVDQFDIEYLHLGPDGSAHWTPNWTASRSLPAAVRFKLTAIREGKSVSASGVARITIETADVGR